MTGSLRDMLSAWDRFWFTPASSRSLSLLRLLIGMMTLYSHSIWGLRLEEFIGPSGWQPESLIGRMQAGSYAMSFWWWVTPDLILPAHGICLVLLAAFAIGFRTSITSRLAWMIAVSYAHRMPLANFGLDQICGVLLFYLMWVPCGQYYSLDACLARRRTPAAGLTEPVCHSAGLVRRMIQIHLCILYFSAGTSKLQGITWWTGEAMWNTVANLDYQSRSLTGLAGFPLILSFLAHATILWEVSFPAIVWPRRTRWLALAPGVLMHLGIGMFLGMWTFGLAMIFSYIAFLPADLSLSAWSAIRSAPESGCCGPAESRMPI